MLGTLQNAKEFIKNSWYYILAGIGAIFGFIFAIFISSADNTGEHDKEGLGTIDDLEKDKKNHLDGISEIEEEIDNIGDDINNKTDEVENDINSSLEGENGIQDSINDYTSSIR